MKNGARTWAALLCAAGLLLAPGVRAQPADPTVWGVYARLLGARMAWDKTAALTYTWYWNGDKTAIVEDQGNGTLDTGEIKSLGGGRLARFVKGELLWSGTLEPDGAVVWTPEGGFFSRRGGGPFRVRLDSDSALVQEGVTLENGRVTRASPWQRWVGSLPAPAPVVAAAAPEAAEPPRPDAAQASAANDKPGPRALSEQELEKLRNSMARDKQQRAEALKRQQQEAVRQEQARRQQAEYEARMAAERAQQEREDREEARRSDDAFASALMGGLNTFKNEVAKNQAERAQQQAFLANLQRQQQQAAEARQRELDRQRQIAAQEQLYRQQQAAAAQQQRQMATPVGGLAAQGSAPAAPPASAQPSPAEIAERQLRERAAAERQRLQQAAQQPRSSPTGPVPASPAAPVTPAPAEQPPKAYSAVLTHSMAKGSKSNTHPTCYSNVLRLSIPHGQSPGSVIEPLYARFVAQCTQQIDGVLRGPLTAAPSWYSDMTGDDFKSLLQGYRNWKENVQVQVSAP